MPNNRTQAKAKIRTASPLIGALLALSLSTGLSACGPSPTGQLNPSATPTARPSSPASPVATPAPALAAMSLRLKADTALAGFNTAQQAPFALCLSQIASAEHRIFISSELPAASRSALEAAGILVTRSGGVTSLRLSKALSLRELLAGVEISLPGLPVGELEGRSIFKNASGAELGFVSWNASLAEDGGQLGILLAPSAETHAGEACPRLQVSLEGGRLKSSGGGVIAAPSPSSSPSPAQSPTSGQSAAPAAAPMTPSGLQVVEASTTALTLKWDFGGEAVTYRLYLDGQPVAANHSSPDYYTFSGLSASTSYRLGVQAVSNAGPASEIASLSAATPASGRSASGNFSGGGSSGGSKDDAELVFVPVGDEFQVNETIALEQLDSDIALARDGSFVVAWSSEDQDSDGSDGIYGRRYDSNGSPLGSEFQISLYSTGTQGSPAIAMNRDGDYVVVWDSSGFDGSNTGIAGQRFDSRGARIGSEFVVNQFTSGPQFGPTVALADDGSFVVSWINGGSAFDIRARRFDSTGQGDTEMLVNTFTTGLQLEPQVASDNDGRFVVIWTSQDQDGDSYGVYGQRFGADGGPAGEAFRVNETTSASQFGEAVAMDEDGNFIVTWSSDQEGDLDVYLRRYSRSGRALSGETLINSYPSGDQYDTSLARNRDGELLIVWTSDAQDESGQGIYAQRLSATGTAVGEEFQVHIANEGDQSDAVVGMDDDGNFTVIWTDEDRDGDAYGIFGLRYQGEPADEHEIAFSDVTPIFEARCSGCHGDQFASYPEARSLSETIRQRVFVDRDMPRIGSDEAEAITEAERQLIADWVDQGILP